MFDHTPRLLLTGAASALLALGAAAPGALARHGADDPAGHDRGDDHGARVHHARGGHDDPARDDRGGNRGGARGGRGADDAPGHR